MMSNTGRSLRILVIDDKPSFARIFVKRLQLKGFSVVYENIFQNGINRLKSEIFDVVFVDIPFANISESEILEIFQSANLFTCTSVFLFSSIDLSSDELSKWNSSGLFSFLKKPVKFNIILQKLDDVKLISEKSPPSKTNIEGESVMFEESTTEQLAKVEQLEKQIQELESVPTPEPIEEESTTEQLAKVEQLEKQIQELESVPTPEPTPVEEEPTAEQLAKIKQLEKQIQELESVLYLESTPDPELNTSESVVVKPFMLSSTSSNILNDLSRERLAVFNKLLTDLKSYDAPNLVDIPTTNLNGDYNEQKNNLEKELDDTLSNLYSLKNKINLSDKAKSTDSSSISN